MRRGIGRAAVALLLAIPLFSGAVQAQSAFTKQELSALAFQQHIGGHLPSDARLLDEDGKTITLADALGGKPAVVVLDYIRCHTLCGFVLSDLAATLAKVSLKTGRDYEVVSLSIDPRDTPADARTAKAEYRESHPDGAGWHFLTGDAVTVRAVADAVGFPYRYDAAADQYAHPAGVTIAAPDGTIARYILGLAYDPRDLRLALTEAAHGKLATAATDLLLLCYCYDPSTGRYSARIAVLMRILGGLTVLCLGGAVFVMLRKEKVSAALSFLSPSPSRRCATGPSLSPTGRGSG